MPAVGASADLVLMEGARLKFARPLASSPGTQPTLNSDKYEFAAVRYPSIH